MEDIRPAGAHYAVYLDEPASYKTPVVPLDKLAAALPHGSGIDGNWTIKVRANGDVKVYGEYHAMNEAGFYSGWRTFTFSIQRAKKNEYQALAGPMAGKFQVTKIKGRSYLTSITGGGDSDTRSYLWDAVYWALESAGMKIPVIESSILVSSEEEAKSTTATGNSCWLCGAPMTTGEFKRNEGICPRCTGMLDGDGKEENGD